MSEEQFESDALPGRRLVAIAALVLAIMAVAVAWSVHLDGRGATQLGPSPAPAAHAAIESELLSGADAPAAVRTRQDRLAGYAWVDRAHGIVAIPIDQAMTLYVQREHSR